jgi:hypothetical protein
LKMQCWCAHLSWHMCGQSTQSPLKYQNTIEVRGHM